MTICPKCKNKNATTYDYEGTILIECDKCGYDESDTYEEMPTSKTPTKHRQVYKTGGSTRTRK